jgi:hypothetical protein
MRDISTVLYVSAGISVVLSFFILGAITEARVPVHRKILAYIVDVVHLFIKTFPFVLAPYLIFDALRGRIDVSTVILLDVVFFVILLSFMYFDMCILTIAFNKLIGVHPCTPFKGFVLDRINTAGWHAKDKEFTTVGQGCEKNSKAWLKGHIPVTAMLLLLHILLLRQQWVSR